MKLVSYDNLSSPAPARLPAYMAIQADGVTGDELIEAMQTLTPRVMQWREGIYLLDLSPCISFWQLKADQLGCDVIALMRTILQKQFRSFEDMAEESAEVAVEVSVEKKMETAAEAETVLIGEAAGYLAVLADDLWQAALLLEHAIERKMGGLVHTSAQRSLGQAHCKEVSWRAWWKSIETIGFHFEKTKRRRFSAPVFRRQCEQMKRAVIRLGILSPWHLRHAESLAVGRRFGAVMKDLWQWTWDAQTLNQLDHKLEPQNFSQLFASGFPWQSIFLEEKPSIKRNLETPLLEWDHMAPLLRRDLDRMCDLNSWDSREKVVCLEWRVVTYDMSNLNIRICFRHPHSLASERNTSFATTTLQAYYSFSKAVKETAFYGDGELQNPPSPIVSWELVISERLKISDHIRDLFGVGQQDTTSLMDLENRLPISLQAYDIRNDWLPEDSFAESLQEDHRLDHSSNKGLLSLCATACKRPLFLYKHPVFLDNFFDNHFQGRGGSSVWQFLERVMTKWWLFPALAKRELLQRDYYKFIGRDKKSLWVFKDKHGEWYVHGIFA